MLKNTFSLLSGVITFSLVWNLISSPNTVSAEPLKWAKLYNGVEFIEKDYGKWFKKGKLYAIKIDKKRKLRILVDDRANSSLKDMMARYKPIAIVNGSYFDEKYKPVGLLKINNELIKSLNEYGSSGILAINENEVSIFNKKEYSKYKNYPNLLQNGPLLVENNGKLGIYSDDHEYKARTALGITKDNKVLIVVADITASPSLFEIAEVLAKPESQGGFDCKTAINLDGGSSTGLRINLPNKRVVVEENDFINNAIGIF